MSDIIKIGTQDATFKVGSSAVTAIFLGSTQVYPSSIPPTPVGFKYKLTLSNGDIVSAETDATSAITNSEISAYSETCVSAEIGEGVTNIGLQAFSDFSGLTSVTIPNSVTSISNFAFYSCSSLTGIIIPSGVTRIGVNTFNSCSGLTSVTIPDGVTSIGNQAFMYCSSLTSVTIPDAVTSIGTGAFEGCSSLTSVTIPSGVTTIDYSTFKGCSSLTSVTIPDALTSIGNQAFNRCSGLTSITIPDSTTNIGVEAFRHCSSLTGITCLATTPPTLGASAFDGSTCPIYVDCSVVEDFKTAWSAYASRISCIPAPSFKYKLTLSDSSVVSAACDGTSAITSNEISAYSESCVSAEINDCVTNIDASAFLNFTNIRNISLPDSLTTIGDYAFYHCTKLTGLTIPSGVTTIGQQILAFTENISSLTVYPTTPPTIGQNALGSKIFPIYVPCESVELYKQASGWASYSSRISCIPAPSYQWVSYASGDTVPTATTVYGVRIYPLYDSNYNVTFSGSNGDYIKLYPDGFSDWAAVDENGTPINISSYRIRPGYAEYEIPFSDLGMGGMNIISPTTIFKDDIDLYVTN